MFVDLIGFEYNDLKDLQRKLGHLLESEDALYLSYHVGNRWVDLGKPSYRSQAILNMLCAKCPFRVEIFLDGSDLMSNDRIVRKVISDQGLKGLIWNSGRKMPNPSEPYAYTFCCSDQETAATLEILLG